MDRAKELGTVRISEEMIARTAGQSYDARYKTALFVANFLGHRLPHDAEAKARPAGFSGKCSACEQTVTVPREVSTGELGVKGNAVRRDCPIPR